jgi:hypothetical protein
MWFVLSNLDHPASLQPVERETNMGQTVDGTDPDDMPPVSEKMAAARLRESRATRTVVLLDMSDEEDDNLEEGKSAVKQPEGVGLMKDKGLKLEDIETSHTTH